MHLHNMLKFKMGWADGDGPKHQVVVSSRVRLARNIGKNAFPQQASPRVLEQVLDSAFAACRKTKALAKAAYVRLDQVNTLDLEFLIERRLISHNLAAHPKSRGVVIGDREIVSAMVNEEDHLRLQSIDSGLNLAAQWAKVSQLESELSSLLFAFNSQWGYLTACPTNTGTALRASALVHLPALGLSGQINGLLERLSRAGMLARGIYGEGTRVLGDFYQISNAFSLGHTEEQWVDGIEKNVLHIVAKEMETQESMKEGRNRVKLEDLIYRSIGALGTARTITFEETMQNLSYARMALTLGWKMPFSWETINELLVLIQPAHIQMVAGKELGQADLDFLRATLLRRKFK